MKGGRLEAQGGSGCVFYPALVCQGETSRKFDKVSKLLTTDAAVKEIEQNKTVTEIDNNYKWHLETFNNCKPKLPISSDEVHKCNIISNEDHLLIAKRLNGVGSDNSMLTNYTNILQVHGGTSVSRYIYRQQRELHTKAAKNKAFIDLFIQSENLLLGIKDLYDASHCHFDIKSDNVVYNEVNKRFNFIDFGLSRPIDKVKTFWAVGKGMWVWPLDVKLCDEVFKNRVLQLEGAEAIAHVKTHYESVGGAKKVVESNIAKGNIYTDCLDSLEKIDSYKKSIRDDYSGVIRSISKSIDTFSLGILYMQMWVGFTGKKFNVGVYNNGRWMQGKYHDELKAIHEFINLMLVSNSLVRMRAPQIYEHYINIVKPILTACPDGKIFDPKSVSCVSKTDTTGKMILNRRLKHSAMINIESEDEEKSSSRSQTRGSSKSQTRGSSKSQTRGSSKSQARGSKTWQTKGGAKSRKRAGAKSRKRGGAK